MGTRSSKTSPEFQDDDSLRSWGSDIDEHFCGPGRICADEWTPINSGRSSPEYENQEEEIRRRFSDVQMEEIVPENVITVQPTFKEEKEEGLSEEDYPEEHLGTEPPNLIIVPPVNHEGRKKIKRKKKRKKVRNRKPPRNIHVITIQRTVYPTIPPPASSSFIRFRKYRRDETYHFRRVIPPRHLKGIVTPKPHFRYRGIPKKII